MGRLIWLVATICAVWVIYEVWAKNRRIGTTAKLIWTISAVVFNVFTAIAYFFIEKNRQE